MPRAARALAAVAAFLLLPAAGMADNHGVPAASGDRFTAEIAPSGDTDSYVLPLARDGHLTVEVLAPKDSPLTPSLKLRSPGGTIADLGYLVHGEGGPHLLLKNLPISQTGLWSVIIGGEAGSVGTYGVSFTTKAPTRAVSKGAQVPRDDFLDFPIAADDGALLSFVLREHGARSVASVSVVDPEGSAVPLPPGSVVRKGHRVSGRGIALHGGFGVYLLRLKGPAAGDALVDLSLSLRGPRVVPRNLTLGVEPRPRGLAPSMGREGTTVAIDGTDFAAGDRVRFGETWASSVTVNGPTSIHVVVPDGPESQASQTAKVWVADASGQENVAPVSFQYLGPPRPQSVTPSYLPPEGGYTVVIAGLNFRPGFSVSIGGVACPDAVLAPVGTISCLAPARPLGTSAIAVTDEFGRTGTLQNGITYIGPPTVASVSPSSSSFTGGRILTLTGTNLRSGLQVAVDGAAAEDVVWLGPTKLRFPMPAGPAGTFDVTVRDEFGRVGTGAGILRRRGPFEDASATAVPPAPEGTDFFGTVVALGDLAGNGDGAKDILVGTYYAPYLYSYGGSTTLPASRILFNDGNGVFTDVTADRRGAPAYPWDHGEVGFAAMGDLDGKAGDDVVLCVGYPASQYPATFTRNGKTYAYAVTGYYAGTYYYDPRTYAATRILLNDGLGNLGDVTPTHVPKSGSTPDFGSGERWQAGAGALGDLDGDGHADLVLSSGGGITAGTVASQGYASGTTYLLETSNAVTSTRVLLNDGTGIFSPKAGALPAPTYMNGYYSSAVAEGFEADAVSLGDLDGDGKQDLVLTRAYPRRVYHLDTTTGTYTNYYIPATRVLRNDGTGSFTPVPAAMPAAYGISHPGSNDYWQGRTTALGDLDGDGAPELIVGRRATYWYDASTTSTKLLPAIRIFTGDGKGKFTEATSKFLDPTAVAGGGPDPLLDASCVQLGDLDGDGSLDLVVSGQVYFVYSYGGGSYGYNGIVPAGTHLATHVFLNDGTGKLTDLTRRWMPAASNGDNFQADAIRLGDLDGDGDLDLVLVSAAYPDQYGVTAGHNRPLRVFKCK